MKFREHRGGLAESMATLVELNTKEEFLKHIGKLVLMYTSGNGGVLSFSEVGYDNRIGWNTFNVILSNHGVIGMTDGPPPTDWWPPIKFTVGLSTE